MKLKNYSVVDEGDRDTKLWTVYERCEACGNEKGVAAFYTRKSDAERYAKQLAKAKMR